jgi:hypothetical protein
VPLQQGVPPPMQLRPFGRQQLHVVLPCFVLQFVQQAPSVDRQCPLLVLKYCLPNALQKAVSDEPDVHVPDWQVSGVVPNRVSPVHASPSSQVPTIGTPRHPGANCVPLIATMPQ